MEFKHIEYFVKACEYKSMSKAAESLYISQQALSRCIQNLESELGCSLFHRTSKGSALTDDGKYLYNSFSSIVESFHRASDAAYDRLSRQPKKITLASSPMLFGMLYPDALYAFQEKHPDFILEILDLSDTEVMQYVLDCPTQFGIIAEPEHWHGKKTNYSLIQTFRLQLCVHKDNPLAKRSSVNFGELKDEKFLMLDKRSYYQPILKNKAAEYGFEPKTAFESADIHQLCSLVNNNKGIMFCVPVEAHSLFKNLRFVPFEDKDMTFSIAFIFQNYEKLDMPSRKFIDFIKKHSLDKT